MSRWGDFLQRLRGDPRDDDSHRWLAILGLNRQLAAAGDRKDVLTVLVDEAVRLFGAERGFLVTPGGDPRGWTVEVARNLDREGIGNPEKKLSSTILARTLELGEGQFSEDAQSDELSAAQSVAVTKVAVQVSVTKKWASCTGIVASV